MDVDKMLDDIMDESFNEVMEDIRAGVLANVNSKIYGSKESDYYDRIGDFKRAISNFFYNPKDLEWDDFFYNQIKVRSWRGKPGKFGHHRSFPWDNPNPNDATVKELLPFWLNNGWRVFSRRHRGYHFLPYKGTRSDSLDDMLKRENEYVMSQFTLRVLRKLKQKGLLKDGVRIKNI